MRHTHINEGAISVKLNMGGEIKQVKLKYFE